MQKIRNLDFANFGVFDAKFSGQTSKNPPKISATGGGVEKFNHYSSKKVFVRGCSVAIYQECDQIMCLIIEHMLRKIEQ